MIHSTSADQQRRARHRNLIVIGLVLLVATFIAIEIALQQSTDSWLPVSNKVLLHAITIINIVLVLVLLFVLGRNLIKLYVDRRHRKLVPGSRPSSWPPMWVCRWCPPSSSSW